MNEKTSPTPTLPLALQPVPRRLPWPLLIKLKAAALFGQLTRVITLRVVFLAPSLVFLGLNALQLFSAYAVWSETRRLENLAASAPQEFQNPAPMADDFAGSLSSDFWEFSLINGGGEVSRATAWHAASISLEDGLTIRHFPDAEFEHENAKLTQQPAADQYNNVTLVGARGFRPTPESDVVVRFSAQASQPFYGTAGVIFQPVGILQEDGIFVKPFDMFGFSVTGEESSIHGVSNAMCYLALNMMPVQVNSLPVDVQSWHEYELRLQWVSKTEWLGQVSVDGIELCELSMPAFGPVEVQVWSDNALVLHKPQRWWEIAPSMSLKFQNGGNKLFSLGYIEVFAEQR